MISTAFLTDYNKRIYARGAPHNHLRLFNSLIPGSEIVTAEYFETPKNFDHEWFNYRYLQDDRIFVFNQADENFVDLSTRVDKFLQLWTTVISKLNFVYNRERDPFNFNNPEDPEIIIVLQEVAERCQNIIVTNFKSNNYQQATHDISRETFLNIFL